MWILPIFPKKRRKLKCISFFSRFYASNICVSSRKRALITVYWYFEMIKWWNNNCLVVMHFAATEQVQQLILYSHESKEGKCDRNNLKYKVWLSPVIIIVTRHQWGIVVKDKLLSETFLQQRSTYIFFRTYLYKCENKWYWLQSSDRCRTTAYKRGYPWAFYSANTKYHFVLIFCTVLYVI